MAVITFVIIFTFKVPTKAKAGSLSNAVEVCYIHDITRLVQVTLKQTSMTNY